MRDRSKGNQSQQDKNMERGSSKHSYEQTSTSQQQEQRGNQSQQDRSSNLGEQSERRSSDRSQLTESESEPI